MVNKTKTALKPRTQEHGEHIGTRITQQEADKLDVLVDAGMFLNRSDAVRSAIRQMVGKVKVVNIRRVSEAQAKREILGYLDQHGTAYPSDIADDLELDYDFVQKVLQDLKKTGEARPA